MSLSERDNGRSLSANQKQDSHKIVNFLQKDKDLDLDVDSDDPIFLMEMANLK